jgi:hypothetical protein
MACHLTKRWGSSVPNPSASDLQSALDELGVEDRPSRFFRLRLPTSWAVWALFLSIPSTCAEKLIWLRINPPPIPENPRPSRNCRERVYRRTGASRPRPLLRYAGRNCQGQGGLSAFPDALERRRPRYSNPHRCESRVREAAITNGIKKQSLIEGELFGLTGPSDNRKLRDSVRPGAARLRPCPCGLVRV